MAQASQKGGEMSRGKVYLGMLVSWVLFFVGWSLTAVHQQMPIRTTAEEYSWLAPLGMVSVLLPTAVFGYLAGREHGK